MDQKRVSSLEFLSHEKNLHSKSGTSISVRNLPRAHDNLLKGSIMVYSMDCKGNLTGHPHDLNGKIYGFSGWDFPSKTNPSMYPLVNVDVLLWKITMLCSWVNPLFRLGHFPVRKLWMFTRGYHPLMVVRWCLHRWVYRSSKHGANSKPRSHVFFGGGQVQSSVPICSDHKHVEVFIRHGWSV